MERKVVARVYGSLGLIATVIFSILLSILSMDPIQSTRSIGWTVVGLAIGVITMFVAINLYVAKDGNEDSTQLMTRPIVRDIVAAAAFSVLISLLLIALYEERYAQELIQAYAPFVFVSLAIVHFLLHRIARQE